MQDISRMELGEAGSEICYIVNIYLSQFSIDNRLGICSFDSVFFGPSFRHTLSYEFSKNVVLFYDLVYLLSVELLCIKLRENLPVLSLYFSWHVFEQREHLHISKEISSFGNFIFSKLCVTVQRKNKFLSNNINYYLFEFCKIQETGYQ